jgi:hypothetical protein
VPSRQHYGTLEKSHHALQDRHFRLSTPRFAGVSRKIQAKAGYPDLWGFGGPQPGFWLKESNASFPALYVAFAAFSEQAVNEAFDAALAHGGKDNGAPGLRPQFHPEYYAANVLDPDGYSLEICFNPWLYE